MASSGGIRSLFTRTPAASVPPAATPADRADFAYLADQDIYLDSACQTMRPQPVIDAVTAYYTEDNACGGRVRYDAGRRVDEQVAATRAAVLDMLGLSRQRYACSFTLNTTYGLNLLLHQLPAGRYRRVVTTHTEHNSVFLATMAFARRTGIPRLVVERTAGVVQVDDDALVDALVVVSAMDNVHGTVTVNLADLVARTHRRGGTVIVDAAQAAPHALAALRGTAADAVCFSAHKMYGPSLGVVAASRDLLAALELTFVGGGQVAAVTEHDFVPADEPTPGSNPACRRGRRSSGSAPRCSGSRGMRTPSRSARRASRRACTTGCRACRTCGSSHPRHPPSSRCCPSASTRTASPCSSQRRTSRCAAATSARTTGCRSARRCLRSSASVSAPTTPAPMSTVPSRSWAA